MQLDDVRNLFRSVQGLDTEYLNWWVDRLGFTTLYHEVRQRLKMGCEMRETARALIDSSILEQDPQATPDAVRKGLFLRFHGQEFDAEVRTKILAAIESASHPIAK